MPDFTGAADLPHLFDLFARATDSLAKHTGRARAPAGAAPDWSVETFEQYMKGLVATASAAQRRFLETALSSAPHDGRILTALWSVYTAAGEHEKALGAASAVEERSPLARKAKYAAALSLIELKRFDGAHKALAALQAERPSAAVANALGIVQLQRGALSGADGAIAHFTRAAEQEAGDTDYLFNTGYAHALAGDASGAVFWLRETVRFDAGHADAHLVMSAVLMGSGKTVEARREFELARLLGTTADPAALSLSATVPTRLERTVTTVDMPPIAVAAIANPAQRDHQATAAFHLERARRSVEAQNDREAINELRRTIYLAPYEDEPHLLLGKVYQRTGRLEDAIDRIQDRDLGPRECRGARCAWTCAARRRGSRRRSRRSRARAEAGAGVARGTRAARPHRRRRDGARLTRRATISCNTMTDQEYREIQLSGKQIVFLFMSLVVVAVVIFLLGVSVGRGVRTAGDAAQGAAPGDTVASVSPQPPTQTATGRSEISLDASRTTACGQHAAASGDKSRDVRAAATDRTGADRAEATGVRRSTRGPSRHSGSCCHGAGARHCTAAAAGPRADSQAVWRLDGPGWRVPIA